MGDLASSGGARSRQGQKQNRRLPVLVGLVGMVALLALAWAWASRQDQPAPPAPARPAAPVTTTVPPDTPSSFRMERDETTIRLAGVVGTESERDAITAVVRDAGFEVDDEISVSSRVTDSDARLLAILLPTLLEGTEDGELTLDDGAVLVSGEALDPVEADRIQAAIDEVTDAGLVVTDQTTVRVLPESVQIVALQSEIDQIFELARTIDGQYPNFAVSLDELSDGAKATLDRVAVAMRRYPLPAADVIGHTDAIGSEADNLALSEARAHTVHEYLVAAGIDQRRLQAIGAGERDPVADNGSEAGRAENRRVDFLIKKSTS